MDIRLVLTLCFLCLFNSVHAEIYKCTVDDSTVFSDEPCADNAQKIEVKVYQPKADDIEKQRKTTALYQQDAKVNEIQTLQKSNESLKAKIQQLQQQRQAELQVLQAKTYQYSDTEIASTEPGVFKKMNAVNAEYQSKIETVNAQIQHNEQRINQLKQSMR